MSEQTGAFRRVTQASNDRIAITRTLAPAVWAMVVAFALNNFGVDLNERLASIDGPGGVSATDAAHAAHLTIFAVLYLAGRYRPGVIEKVLLGVAVDATRYVTSDDTGQDSGDRFVEEHLSAFREIDEAR